MKRILVLSFICILTFSGVVYASINGEYKGNPIVNVNVKGQKYDGNVPAINLNGTTMVPVRFVSESLGADVKWDANSYTVNISSNSSNMNAPTSPSLSKIDISQLKEHSRYQFYFNQLDSLGSSLVGFHSSLSKSFDGIYLFNSMEAHSLTTDYLNGLIGLYNQLEKNSVLYNKESTTIKSILNSYYNSIENYKGSLNSLYYLSTNKTQQNQNAYNSFTEKGMNDAMNGGKSASNSSLYYYQLIQNY